MLSGLVSIAAGLIVRLCGRRAVEKILPASITGPVAMIIGLTLAGNALTHAAPAEGVTGALANWTWVIALVTLLSTILFSRYLKGFLGQIPLLLGAATGCAAAGLLVLIGGDGFDLFREMSTAVLDASSWKPVSYTHLDVYKRQP